MTLEEIRQSIAERVGRATDLNASVKFIVDGDKIVHVDATQQPPLITTEDKPADCTVRVSAETFSDILAGRTSAAMAYMFGKIKIEGSMSVAMAINRIL
ncbi:MAG: SCP2 sterol-binding domain-containing protein [Bacteroidia bacterium]|nr:SCP2 sterol-binding domain-containing protein [Bacteroidia bacterium]MDW8015425.1 SCP2 sterol-binding domain-containing protein [Bacteroidia bacterium]